MDTITFDSLISDINRSIKSIYHKSEYVYNIFGVLEISRKEVLMTRFLADIINPTGMHCQGDKYLRSFFRTVLELQYNPPYSVITEFPIDQELLRQPDQAIIETQKQKDASRRIDIVIKSDKEFIPIEVKIDAEDQRLQCFDYINYAESHNGHLLFYLSKNGKYPSAMSIGTLTDKQKENIKALSFKTHILNWLDLIIEQETDNQIQQAFIQYKNAIGDFTDMIDQKELNEIKTRLIRDPQSMKAAIGISEAIHDAKRDLMLKVLTDIHNAIEKKYTTICGIDNPDFLQRITEYSFEKNESTKPTLSYCTDSGKQFSICIDWRLWLNLGPDENWIYLPSGTQNITGSYNFHDMDECVINLLDEENRKNFTTDVINCIKRTLKEFHYE